MNQREIIPTLTEYMNMAKYKVIIGFDGYDFHKLGKEIIMDDSLFELTKV